MEAEVLHTLRPVPAESSPCLSVPGNGNQWDGAFRLKMRLLQLIDALSSMGTLAVNRPFPVKFPVTIHFFLNVTPLETEIGAEG